MLVFSPTTSSSVQNSKLQTLLKVLPSVIQDFVHVCSCVFASDIIHFIFEQGVDSVLTTLGTYFLQYGELRVKPALNANAFGLTQSLKTENAALYELKN